MTRNHIRWVAMALALGLAGTAQADYPAALAALQQHDYARALPLMKQAAEAGDADAMYGLSTMYWNGDGIPHDGDLAMTWLNKAVSAGNAKAMNALAELYLQGARVKRDVGVARQWAEKSAARGEVDGELTYYRSVVQGPELDYQKDGKPDIKRYQALGKRTLAERTLDQKAYAMLEKALASGDPTAKMYAAAELLDKAAPGNRQRAQTLLAQLDHLPKPMSIAHGALENIIRLGDSNTSYSTFIKTKDVAQTVAGMIGKRAGIVDPKGCTPDNLKIVGTAVTHPLANAEYLPAGGVLEKAYLLKGDWQEKWTFDACGKPINVIIDFHADGMGGAINEIGDGFNYAAASSATSGKQVHHP